MRWCGRSRRRRSFCGRRLRQNRRIGIGDLDREKPIPVVKHLDFMPLLVEHLLELRFDRGLLGEETDFSHCVPSSRTWIAGLPLAEKPARLRSLGADSSQFSWRLYDECRSERPTANINLADRQIPLPRLHDEIASHAPQFPEMQ